MKKIIFIILWVICNVAPIYATQVACATLKGTTWGTSDTAVANGNFTIDTSVSIGALWFPSGQTYTLTKTGTQTLTLNNPGIVFKDSSSGVKTYPSSITFNGASAQMVISSGAGTITGTSTALTFNGTTSCALTDHKGATFKSLTLGASSVVTSNGSQPTIFSSATSPLVFTNGGTLTVTSTITFIVLGAVNMIDITGTPTITFNNQVQFQIGSTGITLPAITIGGTGSFRIVGQNSTTGVISLTGNFVKTGAGDFEIYSLGAGQNLTFNTGNYSITTASELMIGSGNTGQPFTFNAGSSTISIASFNGNTRNTVSTTNINFGSSQWNCSGNWTFGSNHTVDAGTSVVRFTGTSGTQAITSAGKLFYDIRDSSLSTATVSTSDALSCHTFTKVTASTGALTFAGDSVACSGDMVLDGASSPAVTMGTALNMYGASSTAHWGSGLGTTTATSLVEYWNTGTAGVRDDDKGLTESALRVSPSCVVTSSGGATSTFSYAGVPLVIGASATLTLNRATVFQTTTSNDILTQGAGSTFNGTANPSFFSANLSLSITVPAITYTGSGIFIFGALNASITPITWTLNGSLNVGASRLIMYNQYPVQNTWNFNGQNVTSGIFQIGNNTNGAGNNGTWNFGSGVFTVANFDGGTYNATGGLATINLQTSTWNCSGAWTFGSNHTISAGSSIIRYTGTGAATWTTNGKRLWDVRNVGSAAAKLTLGDSLLCAYFYDSTGKFNQSGATNYIQIDSNYVNVSPDSAYMTADLRIGKNYFRGTPTIVSRSAGVIYLDTTLRITHTFTGNNNQIGPVVGRFIAFQDSSKLQRLTTPDSSVITFTAGTGVRIDSTDTATLNGVASKMNYYSSSTPATQARLYLPSIFTVKNTKWTDINSSTIITAVGNGNISGGNNSNIKFLGTLSYSGSPQIDTIGKPIVPLASSLTSGTADSFTVATTPTGISMSHVTGIWTGTPTIVQPATNYTVWAYGSNKTDSVSATVNITIISGILNIGKHLRIFFKQED